MQPGDVSGIAQYDDNPLLASDRSDAGSVVYVGHKKGNTFSEDEISDLKPGDTVHTVPSESMGGTGPLLVSFAAEIENKGTLFFM